MWSGSPDGEDTISGLGNVCRLHINLKKTCIKTCLKHILRLYQIPKPSRRRSLPMTSNGLITDPLVYMKRICMIAGHYGSGKTEISLNIAVGSHKTNTDLTLIDLDIVNPYFRSSEQTQMLHEKGVKVISPVYAGTGVDIPTLPPEIYAVFSDTNTRSIFDVGGDDTGASVLGVFSRQFAASEYTFCMVVNPYRPRSASIDMITGMYHAISQKARISPDHLICNANLGDETTIDDILSGYETVKKCSDILGIPVLFVCAPKSLAQNLSERIDTGVFPVCRYLKPEWMEK